MPSRTIPFAVAALLLAIDRITKIAIRGRVSFYDNIVVIPSFFSIVHTENRGAAFGFLSNSTSPLRTALLIGLSSAVMILICRLLWNPARAGLGNGWLARFGLAFVLGGAAGNLYDRVIRGAVTDFLEFYFGSYTFPAFNAADSAITIGAGLLLLEMWLSHQRHGTTPAAAPANPEKAG